MSSGYWGTERILFSSQHLWLFQEAIPAFSGILSAFLTFCSMSPLHLLLNPTLLYQTWLLLSCTSYIFLYVTPLFKSCISFIFCVGVFCCMCSCASHRCRAPRGQKRAPEAPGTGVADGCKLPGECWEP